MNVARHHEQDHVSNAGENPALLEARAVATKLGCSLSATAPFHEGLAERAVGDRLVRVRAEDLARYVDSRLATAEGDLDGPRLEVPVAADDDRDGHRDDIEPDDDDPRGPSGGRVEPGADDSDPDGRVNPSFGRTPSRHRRSVDLREEGRTPAGPPLGSRARRCRICVEARVVTRAPRVLHAQAANVRAPAVPKPPMTRLLGEAR